jgi:hypothetical protein
MSLHDRNEHEPIYWLRADQGRDNRRDRERTIMVDGEARVEKFPQRARVGETGPFLPGNRWMRVIKTDGNDVRIVLTGGAADLNGNGSFGQYVKNKARALGWFEAGSCPVRLLQLGEMDKGHFVDRSLVADGVQPCALDSKHSADDPCPHAIKERDARLAKRFAYNDARNRKHRTEVEKAMEAARIHGTAQADRMTETLAKLIETLTAKGQTEEASLAKEAMRNAKGDPRKG